MWFKTLALCLLIAAIHPAVLSQQRRLDLQLVGSVSTAPGGTGVSAYKSLAFTAVADGSVAIIDISNPRSPLILAHTPAGVTVESHRALRIGQRDILVTFALGRLSLLDIGLPTSPQLIGSLDLNFNRGWHFEVTSQAKRVLALLSCAGLEAVSSGYGDHDGLGDLVIVDITDPANPTVIGEWGVIDEPALGLQFYLTQQRGSRSRDYGEGVWVSPDSKRAYYAYSDFGVMILDISDPTRPRFLGRVGYGAEENGDGMDVRTTRDGNILLRSSIVRWPFQTKILSNVLVGERSAGEDDNTPAIYALPAHELQGEVIPVGQGCAEEGYWNNPDGKIALIQDGGCSRALKVVIAQAKGATGVLLYSPIEPAGYTDAHQTPGTNGHLRNPDGSVIPLTIPVAMVGYGTGVCLAQVVDGEGKLIAGNCVQVSPVTVTATSRFTGYGRIDLFDIHNPLAPVWLSTIGAPHSIDVEYALEHRYPPPNPSADVTSNHIEVVGNTLYASWWADGLRMFDISQPSAPREIGSWTGQGALPSDPPLRAWEVLPYNGMILLNGFPYGIYVLQRVE